ncbi:MAG: hypothetical protein JW966_13550 [Anaerolineae bacterium]|nr:hypothetical protein [Anaerolineae bacterium]
MPGLYDRLMDEIEDDNDKPAGLTPLEIAELPEPHRTVMFFLLRDKAAASRGVTLDVLEDKLSDIDDMAGVLYDLTKHSWLIMLGEPPAEKYKVNLRRKHGSKTSGIWSALTDHLMEIDDDERSQGTQNTSGSIAPRPDW